MIKIIKSLKTGLSALTVQEQGEAIDKAIMIPVRDIEIYLLGAIDESKEKERLLKEKINLEKLIANQQQKLANSEFVSRAPEKIVLVEKNKLNDYQQEYTKIVDIINGL